MLCFVVLLLCCANRIGKRWYYISLSSPSLQYPIEQQQQQLTWYDTTYLNAGQIEFREIHFIINFWIVGHVHTVYGKEFARHAYILTNSLKPRWYNIFIGRIIKQCENSFICFDVAILPMPFIFSHHSLNSCHQYIT